MKIKLFNADVPLPKKGKLPDSGIDLFMPIGFTINPLETKTIPLGIGVSIPEGHAGILIPRSSIAEKGLIIQTSAIDPDYSGEIHLIITNCSNNKYVVNKGDRVCSLLIPSILNPYIEVTTELQSTYRHDSGLGSTGK